MRTRSGLIIVLLSVCIACVEYTPKPRGYVRIEPEPPQYTLFSSDSLPYTFHISHLVTIEQAPSKNPNGSITLVYPSLKAKLYGSYLPITSATREKAERESRTLVARLSKNTETIQEQAYSNQEAQVYGSLFLLDDTSASPIQFMLTDSVSHFFRGALYYDCIPNADSLAPLTHYLQQDMIELIQSFNWKK